MAVLDPVKLVITNYEGAGEDVVLDDYPQNEETTKRTYSFGKELYIERSDFEVVPPPKYHRLYVGNEVRLMGAYIVKCTGFDVDENGNVTCVYAEYDKDTKSGTGCTKKVKGTIHWINANNAEEVEVRLFDNLILPKEENNLAGGKEQEAEEDQINPNSIKIIEKAYVEGGIDYNEDARYQFVRNGYFCLDKDTTENKMVFNRVVGLKDSYRPEKK